MASVWAVALLCSLLSASSSASTGSRFSVGRWRCGDDSGIFYYTPLREQKLQWRNALNVCFRMGDGRLASQADADTVCFRNYRSHLLDSATDESEFWLARNYSENPTQTCQYFPGRRVGGCHRLDRKYFICKKAISKSDRSVLCPLRLNPENGHVSYPTGTSYLAVALYNCDPGYLLVGEPIIECNRSGLWTHGEPKCEAAQRIFVDDLEVNATFNVSCERGFKFLTTDTAVCSSAGRNVVIPIGLDGALFEETQLPQNGSFNGKKWISHPGSIASIAVIIGLITLFISITAKLSTGRMTTTVTAKIKKSKERRRLAPPVRSDADEGEIQELGRAASPLYCNNEGIAAASAAAVPGVEEPVPAVELPPPEDLGKVKLSYIQVDLPSNPRAERSSMAASGASAHELHQGHVIHGAQQPHRYNYSDVILPTTAAQ